MKKILFLFVFLFCISKISAQSFYVSEFKYTPERGAFYNVYKVTIQPNGVLSEMVSTCGGDFFSIAANSKGFYWLSDNLYRGDLNNLTISNCSTLPRPSVNSNALTAGPGDKLYYTADNLYCYDIKTGQTTNLGKMTYYASGDLTFYKGELYMASSGLVKVDIKDPSKSYVYITDFPGGYGLVSVATGLHKNTVYALGSNDGINTQIYEIDMENKRTVGIIGTLPYVVYDAASTAEDGSILGININKINIHQDCASPTKGIAEIITETHADEFTYKLNTGATNTTGMFTGLAPGTYQLTVTSAADIQTATFTIPAYRLTPPAYNYTVQKQICDAPGQITFTTPDANTTYKVSLGNNTFPLNHIFTGLTANTYQFAILNESGCQVAQESIVLPRDKCTIQFNRNEVVKECAAVNKGNIKVLTDPHNDVYSYTLNNTTNATGIFNMVDPGNHTLIIRSPEDEKQIIVTVPNYNLTKPTVTYTAVNPVCDALGQIKFSVANPTLYQIKFGNGTFPFSNNFTGLTAGTHHFTVIDQQQCVVDELDVTLTRDKCTIKFDKTDIGQQCDAIHKGVVQVLSKPHHDQYTYTLNSTLNTTGQFKDLDPGNYNIKITSPEDEITVPVSVPDYKLSQPLITFDATDPACAVKGSIKFNIATNSSGYKIQLGSNIFPFDHAFTDLTAGTYHFTVLTTAGCLVDTYDAELHYQACPIVINNIITLAECNVLGKGLIQVMCAPIPETYSYTLNNVTNNTGVFNMMDPGTYPLTVTASGGGIPQQRMVTIPDFSINKPVTTVTQKLPVCDVSGQVSFKVGNDAKLYNISYNASVYPSDHVFNGLFAGNYHFNILKKDGCIVDAIDVSLTQEQCSPVSFPSAFTPNNDGYNDIFQADPESKASNFSLKIYNRWGMLMFTTQDLHTGWNGEFKGKGVPVATYYWTATFTNQENKIIVQKGSVTLLR